MEKELVDWIMIEDRAGTAPGVARLREMAEEMLRAAGKTGDDAILGEKWHSNFIERHENIKVCYARKVEAN